MIQVIPKAEATVLWTGLGAWGDLLAGEHGVFTSDTFGQYMMRVPIPIPGTFRNFTLFSRDTRAIDIASTVYKNGVATAFVTTLPSASEQALNAVDSIAVVAGDDICHHYTSAFAFGAIGKTVGTNIYFDGDQNIYGMTAPPGSPVAGEYYIGGALGNGIPQSNGVGLPGNGIAVPNNTYSICGAPGSITHLILKCWHGSNVGGGWTAYLRKNFILQDGSGGTVNTAVSLPDTGIVDDFRISTFDLPILPPDRVEFVVQRTGTNAVFALGQVAVGIAFAPTTPGMFMLCGGDAGHLSPPDDTFTWVAPGMYLTEPPTGSPIGPADVTISGLYVESADPGGAGATWTHIMRDNGADTAVQVVFVNGQSSGSITGLNVNVPATDYVDMRNHPAGGAAGIAVQFHWAMTGILTSEVPGCPGAASSPRIDGLPLVLPVGAIQTDTFSSGER